MDIHHAARVLIETLFCMCATLNAFGSDHFVRGHLSTSRGPVSYAIVQFMRSDDTSKTFSALTDTSGYFQMSIVTGLRNPDSKPSKLQLEQNFPNPFTSLTAIPYNLDHASSAFVRIYDILGSLVKEFDLGVQSSGTHGILWDGTNNLGQKVATGMYFYQLTVADESRTRKMALVGGRTLLSIQSFSSMGSLGQESTIQRHSPALSETYSVILACSDTTSPPFAPKVFSNVQLQSDTTLTFTVEELNDFGLCYNKSANGVGQIFLNNAKGTHPLNISNYTVRSDISPRWSPDGAYIVFRRGVPAFGPWTVTYNIEHNSYCNLTSDGGLSASLPQWTPNGKVVFAYQRPVGGSTATYLMNPDGSDKQRILDSVTTNIYFYPDSYRFLYIMDGTRIYRADIGLTTNEFVCDLEEILHQNVVTQGFDPITEELLIAYYAESDSLERIAAFNITTKGVRDIMIADSGYVFHQLKYSADCIQIAAVEHSDQDEWLSLVSKGIKRRMSQIAANDPVGRFSYNPMEFSRDGNKLAFSVQYFISGQFVSWIERLYVVDVASGALRYIDVGLSPSWNQQY